MAQGGGHLPAGHLPDGHLPTGHLPAKAPSTGVTLFGSIRRLRLVRNQGSIIVAGAPIQIDGSTRTLRLRRNQGQIVVGGGGTGGFSVQAWAIRFPDNRIRFATKKSV